MDQLDNQIFLSHNAVILSLVTSAIVEGLSERKSDKDENSEEVAKETKEEVIAAVAVETEAVVEEAPKTEE